MKRVLAGIWVCLIGNFAWGQDPPDWTFYGFLEGADLQIDFYQTGTEPIAGLGLERSMNKSQGIALEIFGGHKFSDRQSSNTFIRWDLDWQGIDLLYRYRGDSWSVSGGLGYAELVEARLGRDFDEVTRTRLEHKGPSLNLSAAWHFVPRAGLYVKYRRYVGAVEDRPHPRPRLLADGGDPDLLAIGVSWRFR